MNEKRGHKAAPFFGHLLLYEKGVESDPEFPLSDDFSENVEDHWVFGSMHLDALAAREQNESA